MFPTGNGPGVSDMYNLLEIQSQNGRQNMFVNSTTQQIYPNHPNQAIIRSNQPVLNNSTYPLQMINQATRVCNYHITPIFRRF